jgi:hypothetical protein
MNDYFFSESSMRSKSALEVAIQARVKEKEMALLGANINAAESRERQQNGPKKGLLTSLLSLIIK